MIYCCNLESLLLAPAVVESLVIPRLIDASHVKAVCFVFLHGGENSAAFIVSTSEYNKRYQKLAKHCKMYQTYNKNTSKYNKVYSTYVQYMQDICKLAGGPPGRAAGPCVYIYIYIYIYIHTIIFFLFVFLRPQTTTFFWFITPGCPSGTSGRFSLLSRVSLPGGPSGP